MKTILQKRSKFVAGLFHTLEIITCVSLTSCGKKENQNEKRNALLADLTKIGFSKDESLKIIDYCFERGIDDITTWAKDKSNLKKIFNNKASKILSRIQHQNGNEANVQTRIINEWKINEWKIKLQNFQEFKELVPDKQNQVIDLFIKGNVNINFPDDRLKTKLKEFVEQIDDDDKNVLLVTFTTGKAEVNGKTFDLNTFDGFKDFSHEVNGKKINKTGNFSYDFADKKVKICGGQEIDLSSNFTEFLEVLNILAEVDELNVKGFYLQVESDGVVLNTIKCSDNYYKGDFWNYVKDHSALFGLSSNKLPIEKDSNGGNDFVKIKGKLITTLQWNDVVVKVEDTAPEEPKKEIIKDEWGKIFKLKEKVTVAFLEEGSYKIVDTDKADTIGDAAAIELNDLKALEKLVQDLDCKELTVEDLNNLTVTFVADGKVKIGNNTNAFPAVDKKNNFERFLKALDALKKCCSTFNPQINLAVDTDVKIGGQKVNNNFAKSASFWKSVKNHIDLFVFNKLAITDEFNKVKIGNFQTELPIKTVCDNFNAETVEFKDDWGNIFKKSLVL